MNTMMLEMNEEALMEIYGYCVRVYQMHRARKLYESGYRVSDIADFLGVEDADVCGWIME